MRHMTRSSTAETRMMGARMKLSSMAAILGVGLIWATGQAAAQTGLADEKRGRQLAERVCSGCHIVSPGSATTANVDIPTFAAIAGRPDSTAERLAGRIILPHPPMPDTQLTIGEMRDIIAYILSLKPQR
jgi:cytochrome c